MPAVVIGTAFPRSLVVETVDLSDAHDRKLVARIGDGDEEAFRALFGRYASSAMALALRIVRQSQLAEEIVQEAFLALWRHPKGYDQGRGSVKSWLMTMVHHRAVDAVRREEAYRRRAVDVSDDADPGTDHAETVVEAVAAPAVRRQVRAVLAGLPAEQREVLELMYFDGLSQSQIATTKGLPLGTVKSRSVLGMRRMRAALGGLER